MGAGGTVAARGSSQAQRWTPSCEQPGSAHRDCVHPENRIAVGVFAARDGLWQRYDLLAPLAGVAPSGCVAGTALGFVGTAASSASFGLVAGLCRFVHHPRGGCLFKQRETSQTIGPNPTDRARPGTKHHLLTEANGIPLALLVTGANRADITQLLPLVEAVPPVRGKKGRPKRRPKKILADRAYDSQPHRLELRRHGIVPRLARRRTPHGSGLGRERWPVERTFSWLHSPRRLRVRFDRLDSIHEAFVQLQVGLICFDKTTFC